MTDAVRHQRLVATQRRDALRRLLRIAFVRGVLAPEEPLVGPWSRNYDESDKEYLSALAEKLMSNDEDMPGTDKNNPVVLEQDLVDSTVESSVEQPFQYT